MTHIYGGTDSWGYLVAVVDCHIPEQNGIVERLFWSLKEECVWQRLFRNFEETQRVIRGWIRWYNNERPH